MIRSIRCRQRALMLAGACALAAGVTAAAPAGDHRRATEQMLAKIESNATHRKLAARAIKAAKDALRRAAEARAAGNHSQGARLEALAREWAQTGQNLLRAVEAERKAAELQKRISEVENKTLRARALIEETLARRNRAEQHLKQLDAEALEQKKAPEPPKKGARP